MQNKIKNIINHNVNINSLLTEDCYLEKINNIVEVCVLALKNGCTIYFCGNGGSSADAQHLSAELSGRFYFDRRPLPSEALHTNTSYLTAVANDYGYEFVYSRLIEARGKPGDVLIGLSTSGKSKNIILAFEAARDLEMHTVGFTGQEIGQFNELCNITINVPSSDTPRIQEAHILIGHIVCQLIEEQVCQGA